MIADLDNESSDEDKNDIEAIPPLLDDNVSESNDVDYLNRDIEDVNIQLNSDSGENLDNQCQDNPSLQLPFYLRKN